MDILEFATSKYRINFQLFSKIEVNGDGACELYKVLKAGQPNDDGSEDITWNFTKFLINGDGKVLKRYDPKTTPKEIEAELESLNLSLFS